MTKTQVANVIGKLHIIPFMGKGAPVKTETKTEPKKSEPTVTTTTAITTTTQESATRTTGVAELGKATEVPITPEVLLVVKVDTNLEKEINIEKDAETSKKVTKQQVKWAPNQKRSNNTIDMSCQEREKPPNKKLTRWSKI